MGIKLSEDDRQKNGNEIYKFNLLCENHQAFKADIAVYKNDDIIFEGKNIAIHVVAGADWWDVNIMWEDSGLEREDYHSLGLYGKYSTGYCKMKSEYKNLIIYSENNIKITIMAR